MTLNEVTPCTREGLMKSHKPPLVKKGFRFVSRRKDNRKRRQSMRPAEFIKGSDMHDAVYTQIKSNVILEN
ncbi:hypothetical protein RB195_012390 [Necator americanus]|uniref:Tantalus-like domain-containing protein n=1 Tax=Necator americanus TaxID=51031 RepID=A0ABR1D7L0_NECAM